MYAMHLPSKVACQCMQSNVNCYFTATKTSSAALLPSAVNNEESNLFVHLSAQFSLAMALGSSFLHSPLL